MRPKYSDDRKERRHHRVVELLRQELVDIITQVKRTPVERDTLYNIVKDYSIN